MDYSLSVSSLSSSSSLSLSSLSSSSDLEDLNYFSYNRNTARVNSDPSCSPLQRRPSFKGSKCSDGLRPGLAGILSDEGESAATILKKADQKHFLDLCSLCNKRIGRNCDIFMYRGNTPFCSEECREEQIERDEADDWMKKTSSPATPLKNEKKMTMSSAKKTTSSIDLRAGGTVAVAG